MIWNVRPLTNVERYSDPRRASWDVRWGRGGSGGGMKMWIDWFEQGYQPWLHCRGFLKMTPGDGITGSLCRAGPAFCSVNRGRNSSERRRKVPIRSRKFWLEKWLRTFNLLDVLQRLQSLGIVRVNDEWLVKRLAIYFFFLSSLLLDHTFGSGCLYLW